MGCSSAQREAAIPSASEGKPTDHVDVGLEYEGCMDCGPVFLEPLGLRGDYNYCAAFVSYCLNQAAGQAVRRTARAADFVTSESIEARMVIRGAYQVKRGDIIVWTQQYSHVGISIEKWQGSEGFTIEGNTSAPDSLNNPSPNLSPGERDKKRGVFVKHRSFSAGSFFRPRYVTKVDHYDNKKHEQ